MWKRITKSVNNKFQMVDWWNLSQNLKIKYQLMRTLAIRGEIQYKK